jgi:hypothetical protein
MRKRLILILSVTLPITIFVFGCGLQHLPSSEVMRQPEVETVGTTSTPSLLKLELTLPQSPARVLARPPIPPVPLAPSLHVPLGSSELTVMSVTGGEVFVMKLNIKKWVIAKVGMVLEIGDVIKTSGAWGTLVTFSEGSTIELRPAMEISVLKPSAGAGTVSTTIGLNRILERYSVRVQRLVDLGAVCKHLNHVMPMTNLFPIWCVTSALNGAS